MKQNKFTRNQKASGASRPAAVAEFNQNEIDFVLPPDEVATRAYFSYVNQGSPQGHEVQHRLEAEKQLLVERNLMRVHGFQNKT